MKKITIALILASLTACSTNNVNNVTNTANEQAVTQAALEAAGNTAFSIFVKSQAQKTEIANQLLATGQAVSALATGQAITSDQLKAALESYSQKDAEVAAKYAIFENFVLAIFNSTVEPKIQGSNNAKLVASWINVIAQSAIDVGNANK